MTVQRADECLEKGEGTADPCLVLPPVTKRMTFEVRSEEIQIFSVLGPLKLKRPS